LVAARAQKPFTSVADVAARAELRQDELETLAHIGAFASLGLTRRDALWQAAALPERNTLFECGVQNAECGAPSPHPSSLIPLPAMSALERTLADYEGTGMTVGPQIMKHLRAELAREGVLRACDLAQAPAGGWVKVAGLVIVRQRPGTGRGVSFLTLEDETGVGNVVVMPDLFQQHRVLIHTAALLLVEGPLQKIDGVVHVAARRFRPLEGVCGVRWNRYGRRRTETTDLRSVT
jgi:error-prone DNA polymerase